MELNKHLTDKKCGITGLLTNEQELKWATTQHETLNDDST